MKNNNNFELGIGHISMEKELGQFYQNFKPAAIHFESDSIVAIDENKIPYLVSPNGPIYSVMAIIQYAIIQHDLILEGSEIEDRKERLLISLNWLDSKASDFKSDSLVWENDSNENYRLEKGWISGMVQGQAISLYLRAYQMFGDEKYLDTATKAFNSLEYDYEDGGTKRIDANGCIWFEEYQTKEPSFVLNGFVYTVLGIIDFYRATNDEKAQKLYESCIHTLETNLYKYDKWYWSVYDQEKKELVSHYYQKNIHIPLMGIMAELTQKTIFKKYHDKWEKQLANPFCNLYVKLMYRVQPRLQRIKKLFK